MRIGDRSKQKRWAICAELLDGEERATLLDPNSIPFDVKERSKSVCQKPLLNIKEIGKHNGEGMHVFQGAMTHLTTEIYKLLNDESIIGSSRDDFFYSEAEKC